MLRLCSADARRPLTLSVRAQGEQAEKSPAFCECRGWLSVESGPGRCLAWRPSSADALAGGRGHDAGDPDGAAGGRSVRQRTDSCLDDALGAVRPAPSIDNERRPARTRASGEVSCRGIATAACAAAHARARPGQRVRLARAELKRQVADGELTVADVVLDCPWEAESMTIADLLMSQHRWGRTRCRRFLHAGPDDRDEDDRLHDRPPAPGARRAPARRATAEVDPFAIGGSPGRRRTLALHAGAPATTTWPGRRCAKPGPRVAISTMWPSGSRR